MLVIMKIIYIQNAATKTFLGEDCNTIKIPTLAFCEWDDIGCDKEAGVPPKKKTVVIGAISIIKVNILAG